LKEVLGNLADGTISALEQLGSYPNAMLRLFCAEFTYMPRDEETGDGTALRNIRMIAVKRALIQEKGWEMVFLEPFKPSDVSKNDLLTAVRSPKTIPLLSTSYRATSSGLPYYLWDRQSRETVETRAILGPVEYTALSHTWGRWREQLSAVEILGVPWPVPRNTRWDVHSLPDRLALCPTTTRYIWIDLLCIPQEGALPDTMQREIARQAEIFTNARYVVAWLTNVEEGSDALAHVLDYMLLDIQQTHKLPVDAPERSKTRTRLDQLQASFDRLPAHLYESHYASDMPYFDDERNIPFNAWFTSLWTLQEVWLRPDMSLLGLSWSPLRCQRWTPDLYSVIAVIDCWEGECLLPSQDPDKTSHGAERMEEMEKMLRFDALRLAHFWFEKSNLAVLLNYAKPTQLLLIGERRQCSGRRAEAIMSALGATDWFTRLPYDCHEDDLVLGRYPLAFLNEVQDKYPTWFFGQVEDLFGDIKRDKTPASTRELLGVNERPPGGLLPFGPGFYVSASIGTDGYGLDHSPASLRCWEIQTSGHVKIPYACIVSSNRIPGIGRVSELEGRLEGAYSRLHSHGKDCKHIDDLIQSKSFEAHAVLLFYYIQNKMVFKYGGQLIVRDDHGRLVNIARWSVRLDKRVDVSLLPQPIKVDWLVA
jgi:hypothetical protein